MNEDLRRVIDNELSRIHFDIPSGAVEDEDDIQELIDQFKLWADDLDSGVIPEIHLTMYEIGTVIEALHTLRRENEGN